MRRVHEGECIPERLCSGTAVPPGTFHGSTDWSRLARSTDRKEFRSPGPRGPELQPFRLKPCGSSRSRCCGSSDPLLR